MQPLDPPEHIKQRHGECYSLTFNALLDSFQPYLPSFSAFFSSSWQLSISRERERKSCMRIPREHMVTRSLNVKSLGRVWSIYCKRNGRLFLEGDCRKRTSTMSRALDALQCKEKSVHGALFSMSFCPDLHVPSKEARDTLHHGGAPILFIDHSRSKLICIILPILPSL